MNQNDLRVIKTKRALSQSLFQLLEEKMFSNITVNMICQTALIHRTTFYKHFYDKYDLLTYLMNDITQDYFETDIRERIRQPFQSLNIFMSHPVDKIDIKQRHDKEFFETVTSLFIQKLRQDIIDNEDKIEIPNEVPIELVARVFDPVITAIGEWNYQSDFDENCSLFSMEYPEKLDKIFNQLVNIKLKQ